MPRNNEKLDAVIEAIEHFRTRIKMYIVPADISNTQSFLTGLGVGLNISGIRFNRDIWWSVQNERGWKTSPVGPVPQMEEKGMTVSQIINELIDIEVETLRRSNAAM
jgi:hypothetical protein